MNGAGRLPEMDSARISSHVAEVWATSIIPALTDYIRIPNKSPLFDPDWAAHGHMEAAVEQFRAWADAHAPPGMVLEVIRLSGRTPLLFMDIPGAGSGCVLLYGHLDKQPEMQGWREGLGPWQPRLEGERLYGRGGADDGYAMFASLCALTALHEQNVPHARCLVIIESCEESGSYDLPYYIDALRARIGNPDLVVCLDSGCGNYDQLWCTTSLRGLCGGTLTVEALSEGVHSGDAGGVVPTSFRVLRQLLSRIEDAHTGTILPDEFHVAIPPQRVEQAHSAAAVLGQQLYERFPFVEGVSPLTADPLELILNRTWRPALCVTGAAGLPSLADAGNVLRPMTAAKISLRLPPTCDPVGASQTLKSLLEFEPPYATRVSFEPEWVAGGWSAPPLDAWLYESLARASETFFEAPVMFMGEGGTIPFMGMLGEKFPAAQFVITGVLGPQANAHGPNEFLHIPTAKRLSCCIAQVIADHSRRSL